MNETVFRADTGVQVPAVTADEMAAVDRIAVEEFGIDLLQMMENAGRTLASHTRQVGSEPVQVLAGNGGNGGGGLVCARHLLNRDVNVEVVLDRPPDALDGVAAAQNAIIEEMDVTTRVGADALEETTGTIVDALIGYGLDGEVRDSARSFVQAVNASSATVVSLDVPSGIDATTGDELGTAVRPDRTVTLALPKTGLRHVTEPLFLADIGIPAGVYERLDLGYETPFDRSYWTRLTPA